MKKIAIFVEGQTEYLFIQKLIYFLFNPNVIVKLEKKRGKKRLLELEKKDYNGYSYYFLIIDVGEDNKVLSDMLENYEKLKNKNYIKILGLRDLYPNKREDKERVISSINKVIMKRKNINLRIFKIFLAIMEIEAWFLGDHTFFQKIDKTLTPSFIKEKLNYDLEKCDPETEYTHPAKVIENIFKLIDKKYKKKKENVEQIIKALNLEYLCLDLKDKKISSFFLFLDEIEKI